MTARATARKARLSHHTTLRRDWRSLSSTGSAILRSVYRHVLHLSRLVNEPPCLLILRLGLLTGPTSRNGWEPRQRIR
ncbi:hypothetical protein S40288_11615, partial [Stachybotrys chartarum IBT 40288]